MDYRFRPAAPRDREAVFAICAHTWPNGDYIPHVWEAWLADEEGLLAVGADGADVAVAVGKLTVPAPGEGWLEGIRVDPALRKIGWGRALTAHLTACAWARGLRAVRWITEAPNAPMHRMAEALGFRRLGAYHPHRVDAAGQDPAPVARFAEPSEVGALWAGAVATRWESMRWRMWTGAPATEAWLAAEASGERVLVAADGRSVVVVVPREPGHDAATLQPRGDADVGLLVGAPDAYPELLAAARARAAALGASGVLAMLPPDAAPAARAGGWTAITRQPMLLYGRARADPGERPSS